MKQQNIALLDGFWDRLEEEIRKQNISKAQLAERCRIDRKSLYESPRSHHYICLPYLARLCAELHISADYLLFGEEGGKAV